MHFILFSHSYDLFSPFFKNAFAFFHVQKLVEYLIKEKESLKNDHVEVFSQCFGRKEELKF